SEVHPLRNAKLQRRGLLLWPSLAGLSTVPPRHGFDRYMFRDDWPVGRHAAFDDKADPLAVRTKGKTSVARAAPQKGRILKPPPSFRRARLRHGARVGATGADGVVLEAHMRWREVTVRERHTRSIAGCL